MITIGSLSKTHWGGLRVGWVRATAKMITELTSVRVSADMTGSVLDQLVALPLMDDMDRSLPARLAQLRIQREALVQSLQRHTPEWSWQLPPGGLSLWVDLGEPVSSALAERAAAAGVHIGRGARFGVDPGTFEPVSYTHGLVRPKARPACSARPAGGSTCSPRGRTSGPPPSGRPPGGRSC